MSDQDGFAIPTLPKQPSFPPLKYEKPTWSAQAEFDYKIEMLKGGQSVEIVNGPKKDFITIGRLPICDVSMEHPSISRYHAIIQFNHDGDAFLYDLQSAHGTRVNKKPVNAKEYIPLKPGDQLRFGESTRICLFESQKPYDPEVEMEEKRRAFLEQRLAKAKAEAGQNEEDQGASWGFGEDASEEEEEEEDDRGKSGDASLINIEAEKMAFEDAKRRREDLELMYGDDSDEEFYDKTSRKKKKKEDKAETHDELVEKQKRAEIHIQILELKIEEKKREEDANKAKEEDLEDLDSYMTRITNSKDGSDKSIFTLRKELVQLKKDNERLIKLVKLTKPSYVL